LKHNEIGNPTHEITLESGDLMYFPRGVIHEARATKTM
jgi:ribosomal protein L16 Arg81 hydroxylase